MLSGRMKKENGNKNLLKPMEPLKLSMMEMAETAPATRQIIPRSLKLADFKPRLFRYAIMIIQHNKVASAGATLANKL